MKVSKENVGSYKWVKLGQAFILIVLGAMFILTSLVNKDTSGDVSLMLSISVGTVITIYGILDILSGYLLYRNPYNKEVFVGMTYLSLGVVLFVKRDILNEVFSYYVSFMFMVVSAMFVVHGLYKLFNKKDKSVKSAVLAFVLAGLLLAMGVVYLILYLNQTNTVQIYLLLVLGVILVIAGITLFISVLVKAKNTDKYFEEQEKNDSQIPPQEEKTAEVKQEKKFRFFKKIENKKTEEVQPQTQEYVGQIEEGKKEELPSSDKAE